MDVTDYNVIYAYGSEAGTTNSKFRAWVGAKVTEETATQVRLSVGQAIQVSSGDFNGTTCRYSGFDGSGSVQLDSTGWYADTSWHDYGWVDRGSTITLTMKAYYTTSSGAYRESSVSKAWTAPTRTAHGTPTLAASAETVRKGDAVTLTVKPSAVQGNAAFDHFEISDGNSNYFFVSPSTTTAAAVSTTDVPSDVLDKYGKAEYFEKVKAGTSNGASDVFEVKEGYVYYAAREVHEWYGTYPASAWVWVEVEVKGGTVTIYDESGNALEGIVTVYDSDGTAHDATIYAYDSNGNLCDVG